MTENRAAIVALHRAGKSNSDIAKTLSIGRSTVWKTLKQFNKRGDLSDRPRSGRPRSQQSKPISKRILEKIRRNPKRSIRRLAKTSEMSPRTMRPVMGFRGFARVCANPLNPILSTFSEPAFNFT